MREKDLLKNSSIDKKQSQKSVNECKIIFSFDEYFRRLAVSYLDPSHRAVTEIIQFFYEVKNDPNVVARNPNRLNSVVNSWNLLSRL